MAEVIEYMIPEAEMDVITIDAAHAAASRAALAADGVEIYGARKNGGVAEFLVASATKAVAALTDAGLVGGPLTPPLPNDTVGVRWWKRWREALPIERYTELRLRHHGEIDSSGSIIRVRQQDLPEGSAAPWELLADGGVDIRCEFWLELPSGVETHLLVPDPDRAIAVLSESGVKSDLVDYEGPVVRRGITWWGEWQPALDYARRVGRPLLMSFASPRVEQVPGVW